MSDARELLEDIDVQRVTDAQRKDHVKRVFWSDGGMTTTPIPQTCMCAGCESARLVEQIRDALIRADLGVGGRSAA